MKKLIIASQHEDFKSRKKELQKELMDLYEKHSQNVHLLFLKQLVFLHIQGKEFLSVDGKGKKALV